MQPVQSSYRDKYVVFEMSQEQCMNVYENPELSTASNLDRSQSLPFSLYHFNPLENDFYLYSILSGIIINIYFMTNYCRR